MKKFYTIMFFTFMFLFFIFIGNVNANTLNSVKMDIFVDDNGDAIISNMNIPVYNMTSKYFNHKPTRNRKLLLHKKEINKLSGSIKTKGTTIVPLSLYINDRNKAKLKIAIAKGKKLYDKRQDLKERDWKRDKERMLKENNR